jgi:hypothetical protein
MNKVFVCIGIYVMAAVLGWASVGLLIGLTWR